MHKQNEQFLERLQKAKEVLESSHVSRVEVGYEYSMGDTRYYSAITYKNGEAHRYTVRVQDWYEGGEKQVWAGCNCAAGSKNLTCRHILKVAQIDAEKFDRDLYLETVADYKAYKYFEKVA